MDIVVDIIVNLALFKIIRFVGAAEGIDEGVHHAPFHLDSMRDQIRW